MDGSFSIVYSVTVGIPMRAIVVIDLAIPMLIHDVLAPSKESIVIGLSSFLNSSRGGRSGNLVGGLLVEIVAAITKTLYNNQKERVIED
jgi:hypothetical protein